MAAIVEFSDDAIISETPDGRVSSWNRAAEKMYGYTQKEVLGKNIALLIPQESQGRFQQIRSAVLQGQPCPTFDTTFVQKNGEPVEISLSISPIKEGEGKVIGISKIGRDIRESKRVEQALRKKPGAPGAGGPWLQRWAGRLEPFDK